MATCEHEGCDEPKRLRSPYCTEHKAEHRRAWNRERMRRKREQEADEILSPVIAAGDGRSIPGQGADAYTRATKHHPTRLFARTEEPEVVDYVTGSTARHSAFSAPARRTDLQRWRVPHVEDGSWQPGDTDYYDGVEFRSRNTMTDGPYRGGYAPPGRIRGPEGQVMPKRPPRIHQGIRPGRLVHELRQAARCPEHDRIEPCYDCAQNRAD
jgi:hypothetical protein